jgi:hypothetical protein
MRCIYSISLISSQQRNNSIYHGADRWINPVPRSKMLLLYMFGPLPHGSCSARTTICCIVDPASRRVIGASSALLIWSVHKIGVLSVETADTRYSFWPLSGCHYYLLLLASGSKVFAPNYRQSWYMFVVFSLYRHMSGLNIKSCHQFSPVRVI